MGRLLPFTALLAVGWRVLLFTPQAVNAGICEELRIPLRTVTLDGKGNQFCMVPNCGSSTPKFTDSPGIKDVQTCLECDQSAWSGDFKAKTDVCPVEVAQCEHGFCCPKSSAYYHKHTGRQWVGPSTFPHIAVTHYGGATACGGDTANLDKYLQDNGLADGIAAVPSMMYGSWSFRSQACYRNNNLCYEVVNKAGKKFKLAVWGKCGGYVQCSGRGNSDTYYGPGYFSDLLPSLPGTDRWDANQCIKQPGVKIHMGTTPDCSVWNGRPGSEQEGKGCCGHICQHHVDWCGANDHVHFDVTTALYEQLCSHQIPDGSCLLESVKPVVCDWNPPQNPEAINYNPTFSSAKKKGSPEVKPVHAPYSDPPCVPPPPPTAPPGPDPTTHPNDPNPPDTCIFPIPKNDGPPKGGETSLAQDPFPFKLEDGAAARGLGVAVSAAAITSAWSLL